ncbi:MAG: hypothetical protein C4K58_05455 [Flavobacteriaceae bacterium]|nr:MAG: hypothetical protein C4K58_05455 [Flavobacteriaceae bacterium]
MKKIILFFALATMGCTQTKPTVNKTNSATEITETTYTYFQLEGLDIKIPGTWQALEYKKVSGQQFFRNSENVYLGIAKRPKESYSFYKAQNSDFDNVKSYFKWDFDYMIENGLQSKLLFEDKESKFVVWQSGDKTANTMLYGNCENHFLNVLVVSDDWDQEKKISFLKEIYFLNNK